MILLSKNKMHISKTEMKTRMRLEFNEVQWRYLVSEVLGIIGSGIRKNTCPCPDSSFNLPKNIRWWDVTNTVITFPKLIQTMSTCTICTVGKLTVKMASGVFSATSSMSMPPCGLPTMTGPLWPRSSRMAKYVSRVMSNAWATITWKQAGTVTNGPYFLFHRQHFQMHFVEWKLLYLDSHFTEACSYRSNWQ